MLDGPHHIDNTFADFYKETDFADYDENRINFPRLNNLNIDNFGYHTPDKYNTTINQKADSDLAIININIRGIACNFDNLLVFLNTFSTAFDVIILTETHVQDTPQYSNIHNRFNIVGYNSNHSKSSIKFGGVSIYTRDVYNSIKISDLSHSSSYYDSLYLQINGNNISKSLIVGAYYRHCRHSNNDYIRFISTLEQHLSHNKVSKHKVIIAGDFNICLMKSCSNADSLAYLNTILQNGLETHIYKPTRVEFYKDSLQVRSLSLIDHIHSNLFEFECTSGNLYYPDSDHYANFVVFRNFGQKNKNENLIYRRNFKLIDEELLIDDFKNIDWITQVYNEPNLDTAASNIVKNIENLLDKHAPLNKLSKRKSKYCHKPWITARILTEIRNKNKIYRQYKCNPTAINKQTFNNCRNKVTSLLRQSKKKYFVEYFKKFKYDSKKMWEGINLALEQTKNKKQLPTEIKNEDGEILENPQTTANAFAKYFENIPLKTKSKIKPSKSNRHFLDYLHKTKPINEYLVLHDTTPEETLEYISSLKDKSSPGPISIPNRFIKLLALPLSQIMCTIINRSMQTGYIPDSFKIGQQTPVFKAGELKLQNFRPITVANCFSKLLEKTVRDRMTKFLKINKIINNSQFGFRKNHSTTHAIINLVESTLEGLDEKLKVGGVFLDISKAFDCVNHDILLRKLEYYGFRGTTLMWFESYLKNRTQYVRIKESKSNTYRPLLGVPQGGVLAPILFILFTNDIISSSSVLDFSIYADDTCLILCINRESYSEVMTRELSKVMDWFNCNELLLNMGKTDYLNFGPHYPRQFQKGEHDLSELHETGPLYFFERADYEPAGPSHIELNKKGEFILSDLHEVCPKSARIESISTLDETTIDDSIEVKYLGLYLDNKLEFHKHINILSCKLNRMTGIIWRCPDIDIHTKKLIYHSLVESHLVYGLLIWGANFSRKLIGNHNNDYIPSNLKCLKKAQNKIIRAIFRKKKYNKDTQTNTPSSPLYKELNVLKLYDLYRFNLAILCFEYHHNEHFPVKIGELFTPRATISQRETRQHNLDLHYSNRINLNSTFNKPSIAGSAFWNKLPNNLKSISSKAKFKIELKKYLVDQY